ncbi:DUF6881 domain-containing protein [Nocardia sp. NPDC059764]|uniref:DUF6881 domain-containing protein n=1 Tax=Nocardia sp. NPDC059764 TaxID=3346939 RepID=UPI00364B8EF7
MVDHDRARPHPRPVPRRAGRTHLRASGLPATRAGPAWRPEIQQQWRRRRVRPWPEDSRLTWHIRGRTEGDALPEGRALLRVRPYRCVVQRDPEWRRIELFRDGGAGLAAVSGRTEFTRLFGRMPSAMEISDLPHLSAEEITPVEFQTEWLTIGGW